MVVTSSLARGLVRETVSTQSRRCAQAWEALRESRLRAPATFRGFRKWFAERERVFQTKAILIAHGTVGRRRGVFSVYMPAFRDDEEGWVLEIDRFSVEFEPGLIHSFTVGRLPLTVSGHALERMFQRGQTLSWSDVRNCLADAAIFSVVAVEAYLHAGYRQCAVPAERGLLVGQIDDRRLHLRTFLPSQDLNRRWQGLLEDFRGVLSTRTEAFKVAAAVGDDELVGVVGELLATPRHAWLREPYVPGQDPLERAWASRTPGGQPD